MNRKGQVMRRTVNWLGESSPVSTTRALYARDEILCHSSNHPIHINGRRAVAVAVGAVGPYLVKDHPACLREEVV